MPGHLAVVNAGGWGTALSVLLGNAGHEVRLWCRRAALAEAVALRRENSVYLPDVAIPACVRPTPSLEETLLGADAVIFVPISQAAREIARQVSPYIAGDIPILHASKGLEYPSLSRISEVIAQELDRDPGCVAALSGPTHAEEVGGGQPTAAVVACADPSVASAFQDLLH